MNLSSIIGGDVKPYLEYGWVTAPNTTAQSISANTLTTLTIDTEIADSGNFGSIASNQITLAAGTYYYDFYCPFAASAPYNTAIGAIVSLYNVTDSTYISRMTWNYPQNVSAIPTPKLIGQFTIGSSKAISTRIISSYGGSVVGYAAFSGSTVGDEQRTTLKLWKLA